MTVVKNKCDLIPLAKLPPRRCAEVYEVSGPAELVRHLAELGIYSGAQLQMVRPGKACILRVAGSRLCVRGDELLQVLVVPLPC
jgi:Fe2+ transport system protein FeoA